MALRFQTPPNGASGYLVLGVLLTGTSPDFVRAGEPAVVTLDKTLPWISYTDYPPAALRAEAEGRTVVAASVSPQGTAFRCVVLSTSRSMDLDDATCRVAMHARYIPARDWFGDTLASVVTLPVRWTIPSAVLPVAAPPPPAK